MCILLTQHNFNIIKPPLSHCASGGILRVVALVLYWVILAYYSGMKSFGNELAKIVDVELATLVGSYSYTVYGGHTVAVEGVGDIVQYDASTIAVRVCKAQLLTVSGSNMVVKQYGNGSMIVCGNIGGVVVS